MEHYTESEVIQRFERVQEAISQYLDGAIIANELGAMMIVIGTEVCENTPTADELFPLDKTT